MQEPKPTTTTFTLIAGKRELLTKEKLIELLPASTSTPPTYDHYKRVELGGRSFGREAATVIAEIFQQMKSLEEVDLSDIIAGRSEAEALEVLNIICSSLSHLKNLTYINLSDNALGLKGIVACRPLLKEQENLQRLYLNNDGLAPEALKEVVALLLEGKKATKLSVLQIINNLGKDEGAIHLAPLLEVSPHLTELQISATRFGEKGGEALATALASASAKGGAGLSLTKLNLSDNTFGGIAAKPLAVALSNFQSTLTSLSLFYCLLGDEGCEKVVGALANCEGLEEIDLSGNELTSASAKPLAAFLKGKKKLKVLKLNENELESAGAKVIGKALGEEDSAPLLEVIGLESNRVTRSGALAVLRSLKGKEGFKKLQLNSNQISGGGVDEIKTTLEGWGKLEVLGDLDDNDEDGEEEEEEEEGEGGDN